MAGDIRQRWKDGTAAGDAIPNSRYFRAFCFLCKEPIRVHVRSAIPVQAGLDPACDVCFSPRRTSPGSGQGRLDKSVGERVSETVNKLDAGAEDEE